jgi:hypothetical protein
LELKMLCKPTTSQPKEGSTSQQPQPRMKETANSVDLQSPSEEYIECFNQPLASVDIKKFLITLGRLKNPVTSGIEPATFWLVA